MRHVVMFLSACLLTATSIAVQPSPLHAQAERPTYCARLTAEDCALLQASAAAMSQLRAGRATSQITVEARDVPDLAVQRIAIEFTTQASYAIDASAQAQRLALARMAPRDLDALMADPETLIDMLVTILAGMRSDATVTATVSPEVVDFIVRAAEAEGDPLPFLLPTTVSLRIRMADDILYVNLSDLAAMMPGLRTVGDVWLGMELGPLLDLVREAGSTEFDLTSLDPEERAVFTQIIGLFNMRSVGPFAPALAISPFAERIAPFLLVTRIQDGTIDGRPTATFVTSLDYEALLQDATVQTLLLDFLEEQEIVAPNATQDDIDALLALVSSVGPPLLESLGLELVEQIDPTSGYLLQTQLDVDWDLSQFAPLLDQPQAADADMLPVIRVSQQTDYRNHDEPVTIQAPATALVIASSELVPLIEQQIAREAEMRRQQELTGQGEAVEPDLRAPSIVAGALIALGDEGADEQVQAQADARYAEGTDFANAGDYTGAIASYDEAIALVPDNAVYYTERGRAWFFLGNLERALADFSASIDLEPSAAALNGRGAAFDDLGDREAARADYEAAIELDPNFPYPYYNLGLMFAATEDPLAAIRMFDAALAVAPDYVAALQERGKVYYDEGEYARARQDFDAAIALEPTFAPVYVDRGNTLWALDEYDAAEDDYTTAIELRPDYAIAYNNRGRLYYILGDSAAAMADLDAALANAPDYVTALYNRAEVQYSMGEYASAVADFDAVAALAPDYGNLHYDRGLAHYELGSYELALEDLTEAIARNPNDASAYFYRGDVHYALGDVAAEYADYSRAIELEPEFADAYYYRALNQWDANAYDAALADLSAAIALEPNNIDFLNDRALIYLDADAVAAAIADLDLVIDLAPFDALAYINRSHAHALQGDYTLALDDAAAAVELSPDDPTAWGNRADAHGWLGNVEEALADFAQALELDPDYATAYLDRGLLLERLGRADEAAEDLTRYLELAPNAENRTEIEARLDALR